MLSRLPSPSGLTLVGGTSALGTSPTGKSAELSCLYIWPLTFQRNGRGSLLQLLLINLKIFFHFVQISPPPTPLPGKPSNTEDPVASKFQGRFIQSLYTSPMIFTQIKGWVNLGPIKKWFWTIPLLYPSGAVTWLCVRKTGVQAATKPKDFSAPVYLYLPYVRLLKVGYFEYIIKARRHIILLIETGRSGIGRGAYQSDEMLVAILYVLVTPPLFLQITPPCLV